MGRECERRPEARSEEGDFTLAVAVRRNTVAVMALGISTGGYTTSVCNQPFR